MDQRNKRKSYSDLEAIVTTSASDRQSYWNAKFTVPSTPDPIPQDPEPVVRGNGAHEEKAAHEAKAMFDTSPVDTMGPVPPAYFLVDSKGQTQALYTAPTNTPSDTASMVDFKGGINAAAPPAPSGWWSSLGEGRRFCGMRKNVCLAVTAGVCALILGLLITILLVTRPKGDGGGPRDKNDGNKPLFSTEMLLDMGDSGPLLAASSVAAMNWTLGGQAYRGVFYQSAASSGAALMVAIKNEGTQEWSTVNISASISATTLDVLPGTPLAAASNNGLWNLYYLTSGMTIEEAYSTDPTNPTGWLHGDFATKLGSPEVMPSSGLSAMWQSCDNCDNALFVLWQSSQAGALVYANMTNLTWGSTPVEITGSATPGTPVAVSAFTDTGRSKGQDHNAVRFYWAQGTTLQETLKGPLGGGQLVDGNNGAPIANSLSMAPPPTLASMTYETHKGGWNNNLLAWIDPMRGDFQAANFLDGTNWTVKAPMLDGSPKGLVEGGFSAVAMTQDMSIYVLSPSQGEIHEYTTNSTNAFDWVWQMKLDI